MSKTVIVTFMHFFKGIFLRNQNQITIKLFHIQITETSIFAPYGLLKQVVIQYINISTYIQSQESLYSKFRRIHQL
jgi:hypothetical protein